MSHSRRRSGGEPVLADVDAALSALSASELREVVRDLLLELDERARGRAIGSLIHRAARGGVGWAPAAVGAEEVAEALAWVEAAERTGHADPTDVDDHLRRGSNAFLQKDYATAHRIFGALLPLIGSGEIDLGQRELVEEVLGVDPAECAAQHAVAAYMIASAAERAEAVRAAIDQVRGVWHFWEPIGEMERAAIEPLDGLREFLPRWHALIASEPARERGGDRDSEQERWVREAVLRLEGPAGLAKIARATRQGADLRAWCRSLVEADDWKAALPAFEEAARLVAQNDHARAELLDGAALAAHRLGRKDLAARLEQAWRAGPSMLRLRRWLGSSSSKATLGKRVAEALEGCPGRAARQRALLHVLAGELVPAAKLLAAAPGLGWSSGEHPGHMLFPLFARLLGGPKALTRRGVDALSHRGMDLDEMEAMAADPDEPRLVAPEVDQLLDRAGVAAIQDPAVRTVVLAAMRKAAENRIAGVTREKRRRHYGHAAELVATCLACDRTGATARWAAAVAAEHRRFPALRAELDRAIGAP